MGQIAASIMVSPIVGQPARPGRDGGVVSQAALRGRGRQYLARRKRQM